MINERQALKMQLISRTEIRYLHEYETEILIGMRSYDLNSSNHQGKKGLEKRM